MKTRLGKIAQLPKQIRDELNHRLENGKQSPELLHWLNGLPKTKKLLAKEFDNHPITKSNLSDWRHGGFQDWRADQAREARIQRISESGASLEHAETGDLFENFARIAVAELMADFDSLQKLRGEDRSRNLHNLVRDLARLQNSYNRSRWAELAWTKWNDRDHGTGDPPEHPEEFSEPETQNLKPETSTAVVPDGAQSQGGDSHDSNSPKPEPTRPGSGMDVIHFTRCDCDDPCPKCHAPDSAYPLDEALRDRRFKKQHGQNPCDRHGKPKFLINCFCDCFCARCSEKTAANPALTMATAPNAAPARSADIPVPDHQSPTSNKPSPINPNPQPPLSPLSPLSPFSPLSDHSRRMALLKSANQ